MTNCLVTRLKGTVDNDTLLKLGEIRIKAIVNDEGNISVAAIRPKSPEEITIVALDNGVTFTAATSPARLVDSKTVVFTDDYRCVAAVSGASIGDTVNLSIIPKYNVGYIVRDCKEVNLAGLAFSYKMSLLTPNSNATINGKLQDISNLTLMETIDVSWKQNPLGDITDLGKMTKLTRIAVASTSKHITGNWQAFVNAQRTNGRTSCSDGITIVQAYYVQVGFGSKSNSRLGGESENGLLKWDASKMSMQFDASMKVMTVGYTQAQAEEAFAGYAITLCD